MADHLTQGMHVADRDKKKVLVIAHIFPPLGGSGVQRTLKYVKYLRDTGWEPVVVTVGKSIFSLRDPSLVDEIPKNVEIIRIDEPPWDGSDRASMMELYCKIINNKQLTAAFEQLINQSTELFNSFAFLPDRYILWTNEVLKEIWTRCDLDKISCFYTTSGPYSAHLIGYYLKEKTGKPWVADFRDEWTHNPMFYLRPNHIVYQMHFELEKKLVNYADRVLTVTEHIKENYAKNFNLPSDKLLSIPNGYDDEDFDQIETTYAKTSKFTIIHNGLLYGDRSPMPFISLIHKLIHQGSIPKETIAVYFTYTESDAEFKEKVKAMGLEEQVKFIGYLSHLESLNKANEADLLLLIIGKGERWKYVPSGKIYEYFRLCKPILGISPRGSVVEEMLTVTERGKNFDFDDLVGIENYIESCYKDWENQTLPQLTVTDTIRQYERKRLTFRLAKVLEDVIKDEQIEKAVFDYKSYWNNRLNSHFNIEGVGYYGLGTAYNQFLYQMRFEIVTYVLNKLVATPELMTVLELGPGIGMFTDFFHKLGVKNYKGIDIVSKSVAVLKEKYKTYTFVEGDISREEHYEEGAYDLIFASDVLLHLTDNIKYKETLQNIDKALKDEGIAILLDPISVIHTQSKNAHLMIRDQEEVVSTLSRVGLELMAMIPTTYIMNYPFDANLLEDKGEALLNIFNQIQALFGNSSISTVLKVQLAHWLLLQDKRYLLQQWPNGPSQKMLVIKKKSGSKTLNISVDELWSEERLVVESEQVEKMLAREEKDLDEPILNVLKHLKALVGSIRESH